jgi:2-hydroxycyclohexanecarboxyl-CoA dehydrogenase
MLQKNNKLALVAGVANPIGVAVAKELAGAGWSIVGFDASISPPEAEGLERYVPLDMTDRKQFVEAVADVQQDLGEIDALFCATGFEPDRQCGDFIDTPIDQWEKCLDGWLNSTTNACFAVAPGMVSRQQGRIVILSPDYSREAGDHVLDAIGAGTLHGFAKSFGVEMAKENVLVNCLWPNSPFDLDAIAASVRFLADSGDYVSAQVISVRGQSEEVAK